MTSMPTPKTLFGNNSSPNQTNQPISNSPVNRRDAVAVTQSQDSSPMGHLISVLERNGPSSSPMVGTNEVSTFDNCYADDGMMPSQDRLMVDFLAILVSLL